MGLVGAVLLTAISLFVTTVGYLPPLLVNPIFVGGAFIFFLVLSLAEIPVMIFGLRYMALSPNPKAHYAIGLTNFGYPFFAGVYAAVFILLTAYFWLGLLLGSLSVVRFITTIIFLRK
jgi:hypothetical protein